MFWWVLGIFVVWKCDRIISGKKTPIDIKYLSVFCFRDCDRCRSPLFFFTEKDVEEMRKMPQAVNWSFVPIQVPWENTMWSRVGGRGKSPYKGDLTTIRVEKAIAYQVQKYAVWLSQQS